MFIDGRALDSPRLRLLYHQGELRGLLQNFVESCGIAGCVLAVLAVQLHYDRARQITALRGIMANTYIEYRTGVARGFIERSDDSTWIAISMPRVPLKGSLNNRKLGGSPTAVIRRACTECECHD